jgi:predicted nucleic acid-binding protein
VARIFWDTNLFVYLLEKGEFTDRVRSIRASMIERGDELVTSTLTLGEVLVKPTASGALQLADTFERLLGTGTTLISFDAHAARMFAVIRATRQVRVPDAIQLACASRAKVDLFITNDERLSRMVVPGIQFIASLDRAFL